MNGNSQNAAVFRESEGTNIILQLVNYSVSRKPSLCLLQQLILAGGNEEDMKALLSLLYAPALSNPITTNTVDEEDASSGGKSEKHKSNRITTFDYESRTEVIKAVIYCLRESHRSRTIFRYNFVSIVGILHCKEITQM